MDSPGIVEMRIEFSNALDTLLKAKAKNSTILTRDKYSAYIEHVKQAKGKLKKKESVDYIRLKKYDILEVNGEERLIVPLTGTNSVVLYYVHTEELFDILHYAHLKTGHGGRRKMDRELQTKYRNVTQEVIKLYLRLCRLCQA